MTPRAESPSATNSALALSVLYVQEIALLLAKVRRAVYVAVVASATLMVTPILVLAGFSESVEEFVPFEEELLVGLVLLILIVPIVAYFTLRSTMSMDQWRRRLDGLSFALRFESQRPHGESAAARLANQTVNALRTHTDESEQILDTKSFANSQLGPETYDVVVPDYLTKLLSGYRGAVVVKRIDGKAITAGDLAETVSKLQSSGLRLWRLLIVSDREFPPETSDYHASLSEKTGFPVDLVQETPLGFSVVSLGS